MPKKIYIATLFSRREEMAPYADQLTEDGFEITSHWVYGGEDGLNRTQIAMLDIGDVMDADIVLSFSSPYGTATKGGGRHVEFGLGLGLGKETIVVGDRENVFHHALSVLNFPTFGEAREYLKERHL